MIEVIKSFDTSLFLFLNGIHSSFFDGFMYAFSGKWIWLPFYLSLLFIIIRNWKKESVFIILGLIVCITLADQISTTVIKMLVQRYRPSRTEELYDLVHIVNGYRGGRFGFVSSHAANAMALAIFCAFLFRQKIYSWTLILWAFITGYSRIYLGVHYPLDIIGGFIVGLLSALLSIWLLKKICPAIFQKRYIISLSEKNQSLSKFLYYLPIFILIISVIGFIIYGFTYL